MNGAEARLWARFPGNELLKIAIQHKTLRLPGLPASWMACRSRIFRTCT